MYYTSIYTKVEKCKRSVLDVLYPVNRKGSHQGETKCIATTSKILTSLFMTHFTVYDTFHCL